MSVEVVPDTLVDTLVKIKFPLEWEDRPGPSAEWMWASMEDDGYRIDNIPVFVTEAFYGDLVSAEIDDDGALTFKEVLEVGPYYRCYVSYDADLSEEASVSELMRELGERHGAKVTPQFRGMIGVVYDEDNGYEIFEHLVELLESSIITDFYMDHAE